MKASELRIGNLVKCKVSNDARIYSVSAIDGMNCKIMLSDVRFGTWYVEEQIKPIPLTEELLLKCGFHKRNQYKCFCENRIFGVIADLYLFERDGGYLPTTDYPSDNFMRKDFTPIGVNIQCLHQLQNLYFALTGEELEVKL